MCSSDTLHMLIKLFVSGVYFIFFYYKGEKINEIRQQYFVVNKNCIFLCLGGFFLIYQVPVPGKVHTFQISNAFSYFQCQDMSNCSKFFFSLFHIKRVYFVPFLSLMLFIILFCRLWLGCCLIPFCINGAKDVVHSCPNCQRMVGRYTRM